MTNHNQHTVTVLGLGAMGSALARAFLDHGHSTVVWNRSPEKADDLVSRGAVRATTAGEAVTASPLTIACVVDDAALNDVLELADLALCGRVLVNLTNGTPKQARRAAARAAKLGVSGTSMAASWRCRP
jgi:3-hydroxyisobutyrate dehydrogenase-like beta-hydroxyacid dehydrogenase